jgi:hypothetical protein
MTLGAHRGSHGIRLRDINDISSYKQVSPRLEVGSWFPAFHCCQAWRPEPIRTQFAERRRGGHRPLPTGPGLSRSRKRGTT